MKAVTLRVDPPYKWVSGMFSPIYTDNRILMSYPAERKTMVKCLLGAMRKMGTEADVIAGVATSGIPWAAWVAASLSKPMVYARAERKGHGKENLVEGRLKPGQRVIVIEDLISTGGSSVSAVENVRKAGGNVENCLGIFTYEMEKARENFDRAGCKLTTLSNFSTLIQVGAEMGYIAKGEKEKVLEWSRDPQGWGKRMGFE